MQGTQGNKVNEALFASIDRAMYIREGNAAMIAKPLPKRNELDGQQTMKELLSGERDCLT